MRFSTLTLVPILGPITVALVGCSTLTVQKDKVQSVKRVAIVSFGVQQEMPIDIKDLFTQRQSHAEVAGLETSPHVDKMYDVLADRLSKEMRWEVLPHPQVMKNPTYTKNFKEETEGFQSRPIVNDKYKTFAPEGMLDMWSFNRLDEVKREALMQALGVDALVSVSMNVDLEKGGGIKKLFGAVEYHPIARLSFFVYSPHQPEAIWKDLNAVGEPTEMSTANVLGITNSTKLEGLIVTAADSAYTQVFERYRK